ncbi:unnamed protein product [Lampetra fluviatilis]
MALTGPIRGGSGGALVGTLCYEPSKRKRARTGQLRGKELSKHEIALTTVKVTCTRFSLAAVTAAAARDFLSAETRTDSPRGAFVTDRGEKEEE